MAILSVPSAIALTKSIGTRKPLVIISVTLPLVPYLSRYLRALARAGIVGTLI
ncbi:MAG: hypothetical protein ACI9TV_001597 [Sulfurimonas sp.]|jgi:hypothetical protein